ncbi:hypothetical protein [Planomonospora parontospora]|uniref:hypothetical protein n=1 Tax=Planomonospora parontospora TaxID=58119 RepID=UPI001670CC3B|nr:hypothetical protein [Planomonospora parontospora]GGL38118.1 hypothetical protein GCM10014719_44070 [Planomonospora parontospora subsp. antibiotica]GII17613.1 hypothetical protein Ppa05_43390 [Planomonospora parontospora subsp. antibiotica]
MRYVLEKPPVRADQLAHPEPRYYITRMKSYGRASTFLMATGYEQVRSVGVPARLEVMAGHGRCVSYPFSPY